MNLLVNDKEILEKYCEISNKIKSLIRKKLILNQYIMINTLKLKQKFTMIEYTQIFTIIKYQKIMNTVSVYL